MSDVIHLQGRLIWGQGGLWGPQECPDPSPPASGGCPKDITSQEPTPLPKRHQVHTCVQGDVSGAYDLELQAWQEGSPLGSGEGVQGCGWDREEGSSLTSGWRSSEGALRGAPLEGGCGRGPEKGQQGSWGTLVAVGTPTFPSDLSRHPVHFLTCWLWLLSPPGPQFCS